MNALGLKFRCRDAKASWTPRVQVGDSLPWLPGAPAQKPAIRAAYFGRAKMEAPVAVQLPTVNLGFGESARGVVQGGGRGACVYNELLLYS